MSTDCMIMHPLTPGSPMHKLSSVLAGLVAPRAARTADTDPCSRTPEGLPRWVIVHPDGVVGRIVDVRHGRVARVEVETVRTAWASPSSPYRVTEWHERWVQLRRLSPYRPDATIDN